MTDHTPDVDPSRDQAETETDDETLGLVEETVNALLKAARARQTYVPGNPLVERFHTELCDKISAVWEELPHLALTVDEGRLLWSERQVYVKPVGPDNFAFRFFKDGIRHIALLPGVEEGELAEFMEILAESQPAHDDDLLASLWHRDFKTIRLDYVDIGEDDATAVPTPDRNAGAGDTLEDMTEIDEVLESGVVTEEDTAEFSDITLAEPDLLYLKREMDAEFSRPIVHDVTLALLDQFEMRDQERRRQVVDILREMLPRLLASHDFSNVALIVTELQLLANKTAEDETQELVTSLLRDMSEAMAHMVSAVDAEGVSLKSEELVALVGALQAEAIPTLVRAIPAIPNRNTRDRLVGALDRLVGANPGYLVDLLSAEDPMLAAEAARIVGRIGLAEAEPYLVELSKRPEDITRQAAIEALATLGSVEGADVLAQALTDPGKDIRIAAVKAVVAARAEGARTLLAEIVARSDRMDRDQGEQLAFMRAYAMLAGEEAVPLLAKLLNGRKWWGGRRAALTRACAARALAVVGSPAARSALEKAASDKATPVKGAVRVALKAFDADSDQRMAVATIAEEAEEPLLEDPVELDMDIEVDDEAGKEGSS